MKGNMINNSRNSATCLELVTYEIGNSYERQ